MYLKSKRITSLLTLPWGLYEHIVCTYRHTRTSFKTTAINNVKEGYRETIVYTRHTTHVTMLLVTMRSLYVFVIRAGLLLTLVVLCSVLIVLICLCGDVMELMMLAAMSQHTDQILD